MKLNFEVNDGELRHNCIATQVGEWIVFTCPLCEGYERRIHLETGKMETRNAENTDVLHTGTFQPAGWDLESKASMN